MAWRIPVARPDIGQDRADDGLDGVEIVRSAANKALAGFVERLGARVEDPRTGEGTPRVKDVMRGEIDLFIAAWIARPPEPEGAAAAAH